MANSNSTNPTREIPTNEPTETVLDAFDAAMRPSRIPSEIGAYEALKYAYMDNEVWQNAGLATK